MKTMLPISRLIAANATVGVMLFIGLSPAIAQALEDDSSSVPQPVVSDLIITSPSTASNNSSFKTFSEINQPLADTIAHLIDVANQLPPVSSPSPGTVAQSITAIRDDLTIPPRVGAGYTTDGGSYSRLGRLDAFVPLDQEPGETITFLEGHLVLGEAEDFGGSLLLGYRGHNTDHDRIRGGYVGFDVRETGNSNFYQLGAGYESLGDPWDFRLNGYLPFGDRSQTITDTVIDTGTQISTGFAGNQLVLNSQRQRERLFQQELALGGFDAEAGYRLARWDEGDLRFLGGVYLYHAPDLDSYLGWRLRLASNFTPNFNGGLALQEDGLFGSRLILSVGATFPGNRPAGAIADADRVRARLGEFVVRQPEIAVYLDEDSERFVEAASMPLMNPEEEEAYRFQHVTLGAAGGDGTFENPFGTVAEALAATVGDGNDVVYVNDDTNGVIPAFTIPDRVQVLSQGPRQLLAGLPFPGFEQTPARLPFSPAINYTDGIVVELPFSGDGNFPQIQDGVVLGDRTMLAGFQINNATNTAIFGSDIANVEIRNSIITDPGERGIFLNDVGGSVLIFDTAIVGAQGTAPNSGQGIFIQNSTTQNANEVNIQGFQADNNRVGIELLAVGSLATFAAPNQVVTIGPSNSANTSIGLPSGAAIANSLNGNTAQGLLIEADTLGGQEITVQGITASNNGAAGISIIDVPGGVLTAFQEVQVRDSAIANNNGPGIQIRATGTAEQEFNFDGNRIVNNNGPGIESIASNSAIQEFVAKTEINSLGIGNNVIAGNNGDGISIESLVSDVLLVEAQQNTFENNASGVDFSVASNDSSRTCLVAFDNRFDTRAIANLQLSKAPTNLFEVNHLPNLSINNGGASVELLPNSTSYTNISRPTCL